MKTPAKSMRGKTPGPQGGTPSAQHPDDCWRGNGGSRPTRGERVRRKRGKAGRGTAKGASAFAGQTLAAPRLTLEAAEGAGGGGFCQDACGSVSGRRGCARGWRAWALGSRSLGGVRDSEVLPAVSLPPPPPSAGGRGQGLADDGPFERESGWPNTLTILK